MEKNSFKRIKSIKMKTSSLLKNIKKIFERFSVLWKRELWNHTGGHIIYIYNKAKKVENEYFVWLIVTESAPRDVLTSCPNKYFLLLPNMKTRWDYKFWN